MYSARTRRARRACREGECGSAQAPCAVRGARRAKREARSAERKARSAKRGARSAERGARSAKREARGARSRPAGPAFLDRTGDSRRVHPSPLAAQGRPPTRKQARGVAPSFLSQVRGPLAVPCGPRSANAPTKAPKAGKSGSGLGACVAAWPRRRVSEAGRSRCFSEKHFRESYRSQVGKSPGSEVAKKSGDTEETADTGPTEDTEESEDTQESGDLKSEDPEIRRHDARRHRGRRHDSRRRRGQKTQIRGVRKTSF